MANLLIYAFTGNTMNPTTTASGLSGSAIGFGAGGSHEANSAGFTSDPVLYMTPPLNSETAAKAITANCYYLLTATPDAGKKISLSALNFNAARGGAATPRGVCVRSSIDAYAANLYSADCATAVPTWGAIAIDLTGASFQNLTAAITFRIYCYAASGKVVCSDDITLTGAVADAAAATVKPNFIPFFWA